jgi:hypothetical protein
MKVAETLPINDGKLSESYAPPNIKNVFGGKHFLEK